MHTLSSFEYTVLRVVPRVERGEFLNAGVILFCLERRFLRARIYVDEHRWRTVWPELDIELIRRHLEAFPRICEGQADAGPIARLSQRERFHWLSSPRSTMIQVSPVHIGLCSAPEERLDRLFEQLVQREPIRY